METKEDRAKNRDERLEELAQALKEAQLMLLRQSTLLGELGHRESEPGPSLAEAREQLAVVTAERDQLQKQLLALERMQTETIALPEGQNSGSDTQPGLPSIQDLMAELGSASENGETTGRGRRLNGPSAEAPENDCGEMISPEVIAPEIFSGSLSPLDSGIDRPTKRMLVCMDSERPIKIPLREGTMTIGRSESANIRIDGPFVSRIHARIICRPADTVLLDAGSTNGFSVNSIVVKRHELKHGDVITLGSQRFTFIDMEQEG